MPPTELFGDHLQTRVVTGAGQLSELGKLTAEFGSQVFLVSDPGIVAAGHVARGIQSLEAAGVSVCLFAGAEENPTTETIERGLAEAKKFQPDVIVAIGGGSSMDCAKGVNFLLTNGGTMHDYHGVGKASQPMLPMIAVPTTSGTGSEMQSFALISDAKTHVKMACGDKKALCRVAILDPQLTLTQPAIVTALTGIDAISHAVETFVTKRRSEASLRYSAEAWRLLAGNFKTVMQQPSNLEARAAMQIGAASAGVAIEMSMLGAAHALSNPITATYGIAHGQAVGIMLPAVVRFNGQEHNQWYRELLSRTEDVEGLPAVASGADGLADFLTQLVELSGLETKLEAMDVERNRLPEMAAAAAQQWTGTFNPRPVDAESLLAMYESVF